MKINRVIPIFNFLKLSISNILKMNLMGDLIENIYNFIQLSDRISTAGQPTLEQYPTIASEGYQIVINLALQESANALENEDEIATNLGLEYIHIPVIWNTPTVEDFQKFVSVIEANLDRKIFIHCAANMRVSAFMYLYRQIYTGVDEATARQDLLKIWTPNEVWKIYIDRVLTHYKATAGKKFWEVNH
jgi:protein tyrosine phosphatase (PTP) superfamily phosphohydrolase (DUF442 family)